MKKKMLIIIGVLAAVAVAIILILVLGVFKGSAINSSQGELQLVSDVMFNDSGSANVYSGIVETQMVSEVKKDSDRKVGEILVKEGDRVSKGTALFTYSTEEESYDIQKERFEIERYQANIEDCNAQIAELNEEMSESASDAEKLGYSAQIQDLNAQIAQAQYDIKTKNAEIARLEGLINKSTVYSEIDGTVEKINNNDNNETDMFYGSEEQSQAFITILAEGNLRVKGTVSEQTIGELYVDAPVILRSRVDSAHIWKGVITSIDTSPAGSGQEDSYGYMGGEMASKYSFFVNLEETDGLMLGQHVTIEMDFGQGLAKDGIWLSSGWICYKEDGSAYVYGAETANGKPVAKDIALGEYDSNLDMWQVVSGLSESDYLAWPLDMEEL